MKFACERCGRSYALADELRGKTFKMKCKACGHLIVVKGSAAEAPARAPAARAGAEPTPSPVTIPDAPLGDESLAGAAAVPEVNPFVARPVSAASVERLAAGTPLGGTAAGPAGGERGDLPLDDRKGGPAPAGARGREHPPPLPPRHRSGAGDPFADWEPLGEIEKGPIAEEVEPPQLHLTPEPTPLPAAVPSPRQPWRPRSGLQPEGLNLRALAVIGGVAVAAVAVLLFVYVGRSGKPQAASAPVAAQPIAAAPVPASPPAPAEPPAAEPGPAQAPEAPGRRVEPGQRAPRPVKAAGEAPRPELGSGPPSPPRSASAAAAAPAASPGAEAAPPKAAAPAAAGTDGAQPKGAARRSPQQAARVASANRRAFEQCIAEARSHDSSLAFQGRQITLTLAVNPDGTVTAAAIDDDEIDQTDLGSCIRSAARLMIFPAFEGDPMKVEVPLSLGQ